MILLNTTFFSNMLHVLDQIAIHVLNKYHNTVFIISQKTFKLLYKNGDNCNIVLYLFLLRRKCYQMDINMTHNNRVRRLWMIYNKISDGLQNGRSHPEWCSYFILVAIIYIPCYTHRFITFNSPESAPLLLASN